jgi:hypothetical protein
VQELDIEQRFHLMQKEIEALKSYIERHHPDFAESYAKLKEEAIQAIDPEWLAASGKRKQ